MWTRLDVAYLEGAATIALVVGVWKCLTHSHLYLLRDASVATFVVAESD